MVIDAWFKNTFYYYARKHSELFRRSIIQIPIAEFIVRRNRNFNTKLYTDIEQRLSIPILEPNNDNTVANNAHLYVILKISIWQVITTDEQEQYYFI